MIQGEKARDDTQVVVVRVDLGRAFGKLEVIFVGHLIQGILAARKQFASITAAVRLGKPSAKDLWNLIVGRNAIGWTRTGLGITYLPKIVCIAKGCTDRA